MNILNPILVLSQVLIAAFAISFWPVGLDKMQENGSNCNKPIGQPETLDIGGMVYHYQYDAKGRVISRRGEIEELRFQYVWQHDRPVHITRIYGQEGQPEWVRFDWHFIYNSHYDLSYARDEGGRDAWYGYNDSHDLIGVKNTNDARMDIAYDPICHLPGRLSQEGRGSVTITYDGECKIADKGDDNSSEADFLYRFDSSLDLLDQPNMDVFH